MPHHRHPRLGRIASEIVVLVVLLYAALAPASLFEDASSLSDFGSTLYAHAPWIGQPVTDAGVIDLNGDGVDEILISGSQRSCSGAHVAITAVFVRDSAANSYKQQHQLGSRFFGLDVVLQKFAAISRSGSALPDIVACAKAAAAMTVVLNAGGFNFSLAAFPATSCDQYAALAVVDDDSNGLDELFISTYTN